MQDRSEVPNPSFAWLPKTFSTCSQPPRHAQAHQIMRLPGLLRAIGCQGARVFWEELLGSCLPCVVNSVESVSWSSLLALGQL